MGMWAMWTNLLQASLHYLSTHFGLSDALAIIAVTLIARIAMMPISLTAAYKGQKNKEALDRIKPELEELRTTFKDNPSELAARTMALYRENEISFFDKISLLNIGSQSIFGIGVFQCLKRATFTTKFLWISNLAKPNFPLTVLIGVLMLMSMVLAPSFTTDTAMLLMLAISLGVAVFVLATTPSAIGIYWATSNAVTVIQTLALRALLARQRTLAAH